MPASARPERLLRASRGTLGEFGEFRTLLAAQVEAVDKAEANL